MKKIIGSLVVVTLLIAGTSVLRRHQNKPLVAPAERQTLRDAMQSADVNGGIPEGLKFKEDDSFSGRCRAKGGNYTGTGGACQCQTGAKLYINPSVERCGADAEVFEALEDRYVTFHNSETQATIPAINGQLYKLGNAWLGETIVGLRSLASWTDNRWKNCQVVITQRVISAGDHLFNYQMYVLQPDGSTIKRSASIVDGPNALEIDWTLSELVRGNVQYERLKLRTDHCDFDLGSMSFNLKDPSSSASVIFPNVQILADAGFAVSAIHDLLIPTENMHLDEFFIEGKFEPADKMAVISLLDGKGNYTLALKSSHDKF